MTTQLYSRLVLSPIGPLTLIASDVGLQAIRWPDESIPDSVEPVADGPHPILDTAAAQLEEYFAGERTTFDLPLDLRGTDFQVTAWQALADVPFGQTSTYGVQAERIGRPKAVRAIGAANGRNPVPIVLPCHRIVGKDGSLTGFAGGLEVKRFLLDHEATVGGAAPGHAVQLPLV
jgi:methylated-DNA-[protein]-cysteine S-methyltransferase